MINIGAVRSELDKYVREGLSSEIIKLKMLSKESYRSISISDKQILMESIDRILEEHLNYKAIQEVMHNQILMFHDTGDSSMYDPEKKFKRKINMNVFRTIMNPKVLHSRVIPCYEGYNPRVNQAFIEEKGQVFYNLYTPPDWLYDHYYNGTTVPVAALPEIYLIFLQHLTNNDERSIDYILKWIANSLTNKNNCALTTIGKKGIGKGILGDIISRLHGSENSTVTRGTQLGSRFNGVIDRKTFVYIDEVYIKTLEEENNFKMLTNHEVEIEKKGQDSKKIKNYANLYLSSNQMDSIRITGDERRFSTINLTDRKMQLNEAYATELIEKINALMDPSNIAQLAYYLVNLKVEPSSMTEAFESAQTVKIRQASLRDWESYFIYEYIVDKAGKEILMKDVISDVEHETNTKLRLTKKGFDVLIDKSSVFTANQPDKWLFKLRRKQTKEKGKPYMFYFPTEAERAEVPSDLEVEE